MFLFLCYNSLIKVWKLEEIDLAVDFINAQERFSYKYSLVIDFSFIHTNAQGFGKFEEKIKKIT